MFSLLPGGMSLPDKVLNIVTTSRETPQRIPPRPLRTWPCKPLWKITAVCLSHREKQKTLKTCMCVCRLPTNKQILRGRQKFGKKANTPSQKLLRGLTFKTFQFFRQVFFIPVFLVFQVFLRRKEEGRTNGGGLEKNRFNKFGWKWNPLTPTLVTFQNFATSSCVKIRALSSVASEQNVHLENDDSS